VIDPLRIGREEPDRLSRATPPPPCLGRGTRSPERHANPRLYECSSCPSVPGGAATLHWWCRLPSGRAGSWRLPAHARRLCHLRAEEPLVAFDLFRGRDAGRSCCGASAVSPRPGSCPPARGGDLAGALDEPAGPATPRGRGAGAQRPRAPPLACLRACSCSNAPEDAGALQYPRRIPP